MKKYVFVFMLTLISMQSTFALDAQKDGEWISLGVPSYIHMGTNGAFYLNGSDQGMCASVVPQYFRLNMDAPHFKEFYSWLLLMSAQKKSLDCVIVSGCGTTQIWIDYCRGSLQ